MSAREVIQTVRDKVYEMVIGSRFLHMSFIADMLCVQFKRNNNETVCCHIQSPWRISNNYDIVLASNDCYMDEFGDWLDDMDGSIALKSLVSLNQNLRNALLSNFCINLYNELDFSLTLDGFQSSLAFHLKTFNNRSYQDFELWRLFSKNSNTHIVAYSNRLCNE